MTQHSPEFTMSDTPGPADAPDILPAAEPELDTAVHLPDGASAADDGEVLVDTTETGSFGELTADADPAAAAQLSPEADAALFGDEPADAVTTARSQVDAAFEEPAGEVDSGAAVEACSSDFFVETGPDTAMTTSRTSVTDAEVATDEPATGNGNGPDDPNTPKPPTGGNGGHEGGDDGEEPEGGDRNTERGVEATNEVAESEGDVEQRALAEQIAERERALDLCARGGFSDFVELSDVPERATNLNAPAKILAFGQDNNIRWSNVDPDRPGARPSHSQRMHLNDREVALLDTVVTQSNGVSEQDLAFFDRLRAEVNSLYGEQVTHQNKPAGAAMRDLRSKAGGTILHLRDGRYVLADDVRVEDNRQQEIDKTVDPDTVNEMRAQIRDLLI